MANVVMQFLSSLGRALRQKLNPEVEYHQQCECGINHEEPLFDYQQTVENLQSKGWKVFVTHKRYFPILTTLGEDPFMTRAEFDKFDSENPLSCGYKFDVRPNGGYTVVSLVNPDGTEYEGRADCSFSDVFSRKTGREIALQRCLARIDPEVV